jgi:hypothetical protein
MTPVVQRINHSNLIHDPGSHLYQSVSMPKQLPQIAILQAGYPDPRKAIF